jgi:16S rRNA (adenine1518-N6/adenine1519-N6)-dimethyltransferase
MPSKLGQNFLINKKALNTIAEALELKDGEIIIEIGPGHGELTEILASGANIKIVAIEKDCTLARELRNKIYDLGINNVEVIEGDALKVLPPLIKNWKLKIKNSNYKITGNIPYYITGYLLRILSELKNKPSLSVLTIQKEVAERLAGRPPKMNLLAAAVQFWSEPEIVAYLPKEDFRPQPKVESAIIKIKTVQPERKNPQEPAEQEKYYRLIKIIFKQPRKTILNNLLAGLNEPKEKILEALAGEKISPADRPQNLNVEKIKKILGNFIS